MKIQSILLLPVLLIFVGCSSKDQQRETASIQELSAEVYPDVLDLKGTPDSIFDRSVFAFADLGAWFAYALPAEKQNTRIGFSGPFLMTQDNGCWLSPMLSELVLIIGEADDTLKLKNAEEVSSTAYPGRLVQEMRWLNPSVKLEASLVFTNENTALQHFAIKNTSAQDDLSITALWKGQLWLKNAALTKHETGIQIAFKNRPAIGQITPLNVPSYTCRVNEKSYTIISSPLTIAPGDTKSIDLAQVFGFSSRILAERTTQIETLAKETPAIVEENRQRWDTQIEKVISQVADPFSTEAYERVAVKCIQTLTTNWRSAAGFLKHDGLFPSYNYKWFNGFWSWDSWKHAVAIAQYNTDLAQNQILAMYDFQDEMGMIADCVYRDTIIENHNWRDTKPPLSAWAIWHTFQASGDTTFLQEIFPKVEKYHQWWYANRDHDQNGLCEYGSTDGSLIAAKWESGMDNAVRFDDTKLVQNNPEAWSMNRESVDLNAYLYAEKNYLAKIATALKEKEREEHYSTTATILKGHIQEVFYDKESGWFYDVDLETKEHLKAFGAEGWIPLWANAATPEQAARVRATMLDSTQFATYIPFPTLAADHPRFDPDGSYWRGPVWLDQAYFAIKGLRNYGYENDAQKFTFQLLDRLEGLKDSTAPIRENYHPLTGAGLESNHFSWSAAHLLLLLWEK